MCFSNLSETAELVRADLNSRLQVIKPGLLLLLSKRPVLFCPLIAQYHGSWQPFSILRPLGESISSKTRTTVIEHRWRRSCFLPAKFNYKRFRDFYVQIYNIIIKRQSLCSVYVILNASYKKFVAQIYRGNL